MGRDRTELWLIALMILAAVVWAAVSFWPL